MPDVNIALVVLGGLSVLLGLFSRVVQRLPISTPLVAFVTGVGLGPYGVGLIDPDRSGHGPVILEQVSRIVLAVSVMGIATGLPRGYLSRSWRSVAVLLGIVMPLMALAAAAVDHLVLGAPWALAWPVGSIVAPTDPILGRAIVAGQLAKRNLPQRLRDLLLAESGANDGLAFPLVMLPLTIGYAGRTWGDWLVNRQCCWSSASSCCGACRRYCCSGRGCPICTDGANARWPVGLARSG